MKLNDDHEFRAQERHRQLLTAIRIASEQARHWRIGFDIVLIVICTLLALILWRVW